MQKEWYQSKTLWFNALVIGLALVAFLVNDVVAAELLGPDVVKWLVLILGLGNTILRLVTDMGIRLPKRNGG